jgi:protein SCO1
MLDVRKMLALVENSNAGTASSSDCSRPARGPHAGYIPNVIVRTHLNQRAWFYDDLIAGKIALIHCIAGRDPESSANLETLATVQTLIGSRLGRSVFIYSITADPEHDTPEVLRGLAEKHGAEDGWLFLTGDATALGLVRHRLFMHSGGQDCSMTLLRYGNETTGLWGGTPISSGAEMIMERLTWITPHEAVSGPPRRGGPPVLGLPLNI